MRFRYLLDTNVLSHLAQDPHGRIAHRIMRAGVDTVCTNVIVAAELRFGAVKAGSSKLQSQIDIILASIDVLPLETPVDRHYADLRHRLSRRGTPIGANDLLVAAHALSAGLVLVTANLGEFTRVSELVVENWLES